MVPEVPLILLSPSLQGVAPSLLCLGIIKAWLLALPVHHDQSPAVVLDPPPSWAASIFPSLAPAPGFSGSQIACEGREQAVVCMPQHLAPHQRVVGLNDKLLGGGMEQLLGTHSTLQRGPGGLWTWHATGQSLFGSYKTMAVSHTYCLSPVKVNWGHRNIKPRKKIRLNIQFVLILLRGKNQPSVTC